MFVTNSKPIVQKKLYKLEEIPKNTITKYVDATFKYINREHLNKMYEVFKCSITSCCINKPLF